MAVTKADDLGAKLRAAHGFDSNPPTDPEFANRSHNFNQETLNRLHAAENLDLVDRLDGGDK